MSQNININETPGLFMPTVYCSQYDVGRTIKFKVTSSEGYDIPSGATVKMEGTKPSGLGFTLNGTVSGNEVTFVSTDGETECFTDEAGIFAAELSILSGTDVIGTANFYIEVEPSPHPTGTTDGKAETVIPIFTQLVERIEAAAADVDEKYPDILDAKTDAEAARDAAGQSARDAAQSATDANGYATAAEAAQAEAEQSAVNAERYAQSVNPDNLAHRTGTYDGLTAGISKAVIDVNDYIEDSEPYLFAAMPQSAGKVLTDELVGAKVAWNQLVQKRPATDTYSASGIDYTNDGNGKCSFSGTATANDGYAINGVGATIPMVKDHIYFVGGISGGSASTYALRLNVFGALFYNAGLYKPNTTVGTNLQAYVFNGANVNASVKGYIIDLTQMLGSTIADHIYSLEQATAGAGIAFFTNNFGNGYRPYDAGSLQGALVSGHRTVGVNQWDEEWRNGFYTPAGVFVAESNYVACKNPIRVCPQTAYNLHSGSGYFGRICYFDADKTLISTATNATSDTEWPITTPSGCYYIVFDMVGNYGNTYKNDICINISNASINGKYFPYEEHTYDIEPEDLNGIFVLDNGELKADGDIRKADGSKAVRWGEYIFTGNENWEAYTYWESDHTFQCPFPSGAYNGQITNAMSDKYSGDTLAHILAGQVTAIMIRGDINTFFVSDPSITTPELAKAKFSQGTKVVYPLATPTEGTAEPFEEYQRCNPYGTQEYLLDDSQTAPIPVGHNTKYFEDPLANIMARLDALENA